MTVIPSPPSNMITSTLTSPPPQLALAFESAPGGQRSSSSGRFGSNNPFLKFVQIPSTSIPPQRPVKYPSFLLSGVSSGSGDSNISGPSTLSIPLTRSTLPALRRDGSSFRLNMRSPGPSGATAASEGLSANLKELRPCHPVMSVDDDDNVTSEDEDDSQEGTHPLHAPLIDFRTPRPLQTPRPSTFGSTDLPSGGSFDYFDLGWAGSTPSMLSTNSEDNVPLAQVQQPLHQTRGRVSASRPAIHSQASRSMVDLGSNQRVADDLFVPDPETKSKLTVDRPRPVTRRSSLPDLGRPRPAPPPPYSLQEDGHEDLPAYSNPVHFEGYMNRKMEFSAPGLIAQNRGWKMVYVILSGTGLWVFKHNPRVHPIKHQKEEKSRSPVRAATAGGVVRPEDVVVGAPHVHLPQDVLPRVQDRAAEGSSRSSRERRSMDSTNTRRSSRSASRSSRSDASSSHDQREDENLMIFKRAPSPAPVSQLVRPAAKVGEIRSNNSQSYRPLTGSRFFGSLKQNAVIRQYTLAEAETGVAADYLKKANVIRVRCEGEQFLLEADNLLMVVDWIETFQAGANVALDLDARPMPKGPAYPRRRGGRLPGAEDTASRNRSGTSAPRQEPS